MVVHVQSKRRVQPVDIWRSRVVEHGGDPVLLLEEDGRRGAELLEERREGGVNLGLINAVYGASSVIGQLELGTKCGAAHNRLQRH